MLGAAGPAAGAPPAPPQPTGDRQAIQEANSLLQAEIRLAAGPQTYLLIDVHRNVILVKAKGVELQRLPLVSWRAGGERPPAGLFRVTARPPVDRPKTRPGEDATEHPIELSNMPAEYQLDLDPALNVAVGTPAGDDPWLWLRSLLREAWVRTLSLGGDAWMQLTLSPEHVRSLAWLVVDDMPVLIGRSASSSQTK
jgi:hypothetical protein